jgi:heme/copper-type cytochrome/quinol oxidase subunit 3
MIIEKNEKNETITVRIGAAYVTMTIGEWSKLISNPKMTTSLVT